MKLNETLLSALAAVIDMARQHIEDIESGIEDGSYCASENEDLPSKKAALEYIKEGFRQHADIEGNLPADSWLRTLKVGDEVWWTDPDEGNSSGVYSVDQIFAPSVSDNDTILVLKSEAGSVAEVYAEELSPVNRAAIRHYLLVMHGDVEPSLARYSSDEEVLEAAKAHRESDPDMDDGLYSLTVRQDGTLVAESFSGAALEPDEE